MKNHQKGFVIPLVIAFVAILMIGGGVYVYKESTKETTVPAGGAETEVSIETQNTANASTSVSDNLNLYTNSRYGFSFEYPKTWKIVKENDCYPAGNCNTEFSTGNGLSRVYLTINKTTSTTSAKVMRQKELAIINGNYVTPEFGVATDYSKEGSRYEISDSTNSNGVHVYQTNFTGKYSIVSRSYYFDTNKEGTISISTDSENLSDKSFYINFPEVKQLTASIKITN